MDSCFVSGVAGFLARKSFHNDSEVQMAVTTWLQTLVVESYDTGIETLVHRFDKYLDKSGGYVER